MDKTPKWTISGTLSFMELVGLNMTMRAIVGLTKTMLVFGREVVFQKLFTAKKKKNITFTF